MSEQRPPIVVCKSLDEILPVLRYELKLSGVTQQELAEHLGVAYVTVNRLLGGKAPLTLQQLNNILAILGIGLALAPPKADGVDFTAPPRKRKTPALLGVTLHDLFKAGKIKAGDILSAVPGNYDAIAEVGLRGDLILEDGSEYTGPSTAAKAVRGTTTNGWTFWARDGKSLDALRREILAGE